MHHSAAIVTSLLTLALVSAIYYCNILSKEGSWLRSEMLAMILLALLTGLFPIALTASLIGLWSAFAAGLGVDALVSAGIDLASIAAVVLAIAVFSALVRATNRAGRAPNNLTPLTPRPKPHRPTERPMRKAA